MYLKNVNINQFQEGLYTLRVDSIQVATERLFNMLERTERSLSAIEQRTITKDDDPFAGLTDKQLEAIANSTVKVRIIDERPTSDKLTEPKVD